MLKLDALIDSRNSILSRQSVRLSDKKAKKHAKVLFNKTQQAKVQRNATVHTMSRRKSSFDTVFHPLCSEIEKYF